MPARKPKFFDGDVVEAVQSYAWHSEAIGGSVVVQVGTRHAADSDLVKANPQNFISLDATQLEHEARLRELYRNDEPRVEPPPLVELVAPLADEDAVVVCGPVLGVPEGKQMRKDDPIVKEQPDAFVDVVGEGRTRENSVVALSTIRQGAGDGSTRVVFAGQWIAKDDPLVDLHPLQFALPAANPAATSARGRKR